MKNTDKPWISNYPPLKAWLDKIEAQCQEQVPMGDPRDPIAYMEKWITPAGRVFVVEVRGARMGWNVYTASASPLISESITDAERRLGVGEEQT